MAGNAGYECTSCNGFHSKRAFISHARNDEEIACKVKKGCCEAGVAPFLFEFSLESTSQNRPADTIAEKVAASDFLFVVLGPSVSEAYWIQAWIGFEIGISKGLSIETNSPKNVIVLQDIHQGTKVSVPMCDALFLFDFSSNEGWDQYQGMVTVLAKLRAGGKFYKTANRFRSATMKANVKCANCKSTYEAWITKRDALKLGKGFNPIKMEAEWHGECTIECPSCDKMVTRCFIQMLPS